MMMDYTRYVSLIAMPAGFGLAAIASPLLVLFGPQYVQGAPLVLAQLAQERRI
jgi:O-antigen/teichoic acid export membrane protein